jgi:hypothetical protein
MHTPGVHIETLHEPVRYTSGQIDRARVLAQLLNRGTLILTEAPFR